MVADDAQDDDRSWGEVSDAIQRDQAGDERDRAGLIRDAAGSERDAAGERRDVAGRERDTASDLRDDAGDERDAAADRRDITAEIAVDWTDPTSRDLAQARSADARREAASDRRLALQDRRAGAIARASAEHDRRHSRTDRSAGAGERRRSSSDRGTALTDRSASAADREHAAHDDLTGAYTRGAGLVELEREIERARSTGQPLTIAFADVDQLKAVNDSRGHAAGDRMLVEVAMTIRARLRRYDLIIRHGGDEFVCVASGIDLKTFGARLANVNTLLATGYEHGSVTIGFAELAPTDSWESLLDRADADLYDQRRRTARSNS